MSSPTSVQLLFQFKPPSFPVKLAIGSKSSLALFPSMVLKEYLPEMSETVDCVIPSPISTIPLQFASIYKSTLTPAAPISPSYNPLSGKASTKTFPLNKFSLELAIQVETLTLTNATSQMPGYSTEQMRYSKVSVP